MEFPNAEMQQYFQSLPAFVQESIKQTGVTFSSMSELQNCAESMLHKQ